MAGQFREGKPDPLIAARVVENERICELFRLTTAITCSNVGEDGKTLFITAESKSPREDLRLVMRRYAQDSRVVSIPGHRSGLFVRPAVDELARQLQNALELAEGKGPP